MVVTGDEDILCFDIPMHKVFRMQVCDSFADISEIPPDEIFTELPIAEFYFLVKGSTGSVLQNHVGDIFILLIVVVEKFDDVGVVKFMVNIDLFFGVFVVDLDEKGSTIFMATI